VSGNLRQASPERLPKFTTFGLTERIAAPVERREAPATATVEYSFGPVPGPHVFPRALLAADLPEVVGDLMFEDGDEPGADRRATAYVWRIRRAARNVSCIRSEAVSGSCTRETANRKRLSPC
jgi:hypothetical protein